MISITEQLKDKLTHIPELPGIYKMLDSHGNIIYIGKSNCLKKRVNSYFTASPKWEKVKKMVSFIEDIEYIVTDTHLEARLLECELIKTIRPNYNSQMKHDRGYVFLKVEDYNVNNPLSITDQRVDQSFGPLRRKFALQELIGRMKNIYPIIKNGKQYEFDYHIFPVSMERAVYLENQNNLLELFTDEERLELLLIGLEEKMNEASSQYKFEMASLYRDMLLGLRYLKYGISGYRHLYHEQILLQLPIPEGMKLFFVLNGSILLTEKSSDFTKKEINQFIKKGKNIITTPSLDRDEKANIDFRDILYSEIMSLPENMVRIIK